MEVVWQLLKVGYSPNDTDKLGNTALHLAAASGFKKIVQTLIDDNPKLTNRYTQGRSPLKILFDPNDRGDRSSYLFKSNDFLHMTNKRLKVKKNDKNRFLKIALEFLYNYKISSILVEGGSFTIQEFINQKIFDEIRIFKTNNKLNSGTRAPILPKNIEEKIVKVYN